MADFYFYGTWEDSWRYMEILACMRRFTFVVDMWYTEPIPVQFETLTDEVKDIVYKQRGLYLWSKEFSRFPPIFGKPTSSGLMRIHLSESGPALDLVLPACFEYEGRLSVGLGWFGYQPQYQNPETGEWYKPPEALKRTYQEIRTLLRKNMVKRFVRSRIITGHGIRPTIDTLWLGRDAAALLETGKADILVGDESMWKRGAELKKTRGELEPLSDEYE